MYKKVSPTKMLQDEGFSYHGHEELYNLLDEKQEYAERLVEAFSALKKAGISYKINPEYYQLVIEENLYYFAEYLKETMMVLKQFDIHFVGNESFYKDIISQSYIISRIAVGFNALKSAGISFLNNEDLYQQVIKHAQYTTKLVSGLNILREHGLYFQNDHAIYRAVIKNMGYADKVDRGICLVKRAGVDLIGNKEIYAIVFNQLNLLDQFETLMDALTKAGVLFKNDRDIYIATLKKVKYTDELSVIFESLADSSIYYQPHKKIYLDIIRKISVYQSNSKNLKHNLRALKKLGIDIPNCPMVINDNLLLFHGRLAEKILNILSKAKLDYNNCVKMAGKIFSHLRKDCPDIHNLYQAANYIVENFDPKNIEQHDSMLKKVEEILSYEENLTMGPLNLSTATIKIESLLMQMSQMSIDEIDIHFNNHIEHYILEMPSEEEKAQVEKVNLSLLIWNANLSQLNLEAEVIGYLGCLLGKILDEHLWLVPSNNPAVGDLHDVQQRAIAIYTNYSYMNINRFFRGEALNPDNKYKLSKSKDMLACFILGCLLNDAANKIIGLPALEERLGQANKSMEENLKQVSNSVVRKEVLSAKMIKKRTGPPYTLPALTSYSLFEKGSDLISETKTTYTILNNPPTNNIINRDELEVLLPQGYQIVTTKKDDRLISKIINSPQYETLNCYWSNFALVHAHEHFLSQPYKDKKDCIQLNNMIIHRPNHNVAHTYRVILYIDVVLRYFACYADSEGFRIFCQDITHQEKEWLRVAAAFSVTGRESEIGHNEDIKKYRDYRVASQNNFNLFIQTTKNQQCLNLNKVMQDVILKMGDPQFSNEENYYYHVLSVAHQLDLARCYTKDRYLEQMQFCLNLSKESDKQNLAFGGLIKYAQQLIYAHGSKLCCMMNSKDILI